MNAIKAVLIILSALMLFGCDDKADSENEADAGPGPVGLNDAPPLFEYVPGDPGRTTGVRATVSMEGVDMVTAPIEMVLLSPEAPPADIDAVHLPETATPPSTTVDRALALDTLPSPGEEVAAVGTVGGNVCYMVYSVTGGSLGASESISAMLLFGKEGMYKLGSHTEAVYYPPDWGNISYAVGTGCIAGDRETEISAEYLRSLSAITVTAGVMIYSQGYSVFTSPGKGMVRAYQYSTGVGMSVSLFTLLLPVSFSVSVDVNSAPIGPVGPRFVAPWPSSATGSGSDGYAALPEQLMLMSNQAALDAAPKINAFELALAGLRAAQSLGDDSYESVLTREIAVTALPVLEELGNPGTGGLAENVPAGSNSDFWAEFLNRSGTELVSGAPNTAVDGLLEDFNNGLTAAGDDTNAIMAASSANQEKVSHAIPSTVALSAVLTEAEVAVPLADELEAWVAPEADDLERYVDPTVQYVDIPSGTEAEVYLTAAEVAALVDRPVEDMDGATVLVNAGADIVDEQFVLSGDSLGLVFTLSSNAMLVRFDVDLSTAAGVFPDDVATWIVRPALRIIRTRAGAPHAAFLNGPTRFASGAPTTLSVGVVDENNRLIQRPFTALFTDADGNEIGSVDAEGGIARLQYIPAPTQPTLTEVTAATLLLNDVETPGIELTGTGFSVDATVVVNGISLSEDNEISVVSPESILAILPADMTAGTIEVVVENPSGYETNAVSTDL